MLLLHAIRRKILVRWLREKINRDPHGLSRTRAFFAAIVPVVVFLLFWHVATTRFYVAPRIYPQPLDVWDEVLGILSGQSAAVGTSYEHAVATGQRVLSAFIIAMSLGTLAGVAMGRSKFLFDVLDGLLWVFLSIPSIIWAFILVVTIGIREVVPILALLGILLPVVAIQVAEGTKSLPAGIQELANSYKVFGFERLQHVYIPFLIPFIASSARVAFALGIRIIVVAEVVGLSRGVGFEMNYWYATVEMAPLVAWSILLATVGLVIDFTVFSPIERRATVWRGDNGTQKRRIPTALQSHQ